jgi:hypothetical protein
MSIGLGSFRDEALLTGTRPSELQNRVHQFNSGRSRHLLVLDLSSIFRTVLVRGSRSRRVSPAAVPVDYNLSEIHNQISAIWRYPVSRGGCEVASIHLFSN